MEKTAINLSAASVRVTACGTAPYSVYGAPGDAPPALELYLRFAANGNAAEALPAPFSTDGAPVFAHRDGVYVRIAGADGRLRAPLYAGELRHFWPDVQNYAYLPAEDMAIHKSVAQFVDKAHRVRATRRNCYVRRSGLFLPVLPPRGRENGAADEDPLSGESLFQLDADDRRRFVEYGKEKDMHAYLVHVLFRLFY